MTPTLTRLPIPDNLTISWEQPDDDRLFWTSDRMHYPGALTLLDGTVTTTFNEGGLNYSLELYSLPVRMRVRRFWTRYYQAVAPVTTSDEELAAMGERSEERIRAAIARLGELWDTEWLPEIRAHIEFLEGYRLSDLSTSELLDHLDEAMRRLSRLWQIHFELDIPRYAATVLYDDLYQELFEPDSPLSSYALLQGFENKTVQSGLEQWRLSRKASATPAVRAIFEGRPVNEILVALEATPEGRSFLFELRGYLNEFGRRGATWSIALPTWREDPTPVIRNIKDFMGHPERDPNLEQAALIAARDRAIANARAHLIGYPEPVRQQFEFMLRAAQLSNVLAEDHGYWIDFRAMAALRSVFLEFGRRFAAAGVVDDASDVFHLAPDEIRETARQLPRIVRHELVKERKAEIEQYRSVALPDSFGVMPPGPPPDDVISRALGKFFGVPPAKSDDPDVLPGAAGSAGVARGPARILRSLDEAHRLQPGDVLVATMTSPSWTPLFATAAAIVTDTGGVLCHCAVVAREYGIPAVVGTGAATSRMLDGQLIEVDGDRGVVRITTGP